MPPISGGTFRRRMEAVKREEAANSDVAILRSMPDADDLYRLGRDPIDDYIGPNRRKFACASHDAGPAALWEMFETITSGRELNGDPRGGGEIAIADVISDFRKVV
jgi:hypothetical protein